MPTDNPPHSPTPGQINKLRSLLERAGVSPGAADDPGRGVLSHETRPRLAQFFERMSPEDRQRLRQELDLDRHRDQAALEALIAERPPGYRDAQPGDEPPTRSPPPGPNLYHSYRPSASGFNSGRRPPARVIRERPPETTAGHSATGVHAWSTKAFDDAKL
jgi:hypothetical protein